VPYRVDFRCAAGDAFDRRVDLGALDVDCVPDGRVSALMPDSVAPERLARVLGIEDVVTSPATGRDAESVWILDPGPFRVGALRIVPAHRDDGPGDLRLLDARAFGTGRHPTTAPNHSPPASRLHRVRAYGRRSRTASP